MSYSIHAIDPSRLDAIRTGETDEHGHPFRVYPALGWEPLRCCLRRAQEGESIALIAYSPLTADSAWTETGPVYVHARRCAGYDRTAGLPPDFRTGPRVLRGYRSDGSLDYGAVRVVSDEVDIEVGVRELLAAGTAEVHVRAFETQCFLYAVRP